MIRCLGRLPLGTVYSYYYDTSVFFSISRIGAFFSKKKSKYSGIARACSLAVYPGCAIGIESEKFGAVVDFVHPRMNPPASAKTLFRYTYSCIQTSHVLHRTCTLYYFDYSEFRAPRARRRRRGIPLYAAARTQV